LGLLLVSSWIGHRKLLCGWPPRVQSECHPLASRIGLRNCKQVRRTNGSRPKAPGQNSGLRCQAVPEDGSPYQRLYRIRSSSRPNVGYFARFSGLRRYQAAPKRSAEKMIFRIVGSPETSKCKGHEAAKGHNRGRDITGATSIPPNAVRMAGWLRVGSECSA
jgi:hypothetical protein